MDKKIKGTRIFLIIYGSAITFVSFYASLILLLVNQGPTTSLSYEKKGLIFLPFLILIGLAFLLFGIFINKVKSKRKLIFLLICALSIIWYILHTICVQLNGLGLFPNIETTDTNSVISNILSYFKMFVLSAFFVVPELIIWRNLKRIERQNKIEENNNAT